MSRGLYGIADVGVITSRGLSLEDGIRALLDGGAPIIQLRWKDAQAARLLEAARLLVRLCRDAGVVSIVNDRVDVAAAAGAGGVHLGQDDLDVAAARGILARGSLVGVSTHDLDQVEAALTDGVDYIGFGPIFATSTKERPDPVVGLDLLREAVRLVAGRIPIVAIGGIEAERVPDVARTGTDYAAIISDVFRAASPIERATEVHRALRSSAFDQESTDS